MISVGPCKTTDFSVKQRREQVNVIVQQGVGFLNTSQVFTVTHLSEIQKYRQYKGIMVHNAGPSGRAV